jgi:SAM-dependent methyltransferase
LRGPGYEGASDEENLKAYREAAERLFGVIRGLGLDLGRVRVLDIGCGNGFYAGLFKDAGVVDYTGVDVTDVLFPRLREAYPGYQFVQKDITSEGMGAERFDLVLMIDVIEHIVTSEKLNNAMENVKGCLKAGGVFMVSPVFKSDRRLLFNVKEWMREDIVSRFEGYALDVVSGFRGADMLLVRRG